MTNILEIIYLIVATILFINLIVLCILLIIEIIKSNF